MSDKLNCILGSCLALAFLALASVAIAQPDPGVPGPLDISRAEYDYGDSAFLFEGRDDRPTEVRAVVWYPTDLSTGPFPLVVFLHGWHYTCYQGLTPFQGEWPCGLPHLPIPNYIGYEYEQQILASYGYIVVSISANGVNARDTMYTDVGMLWRAQLLQAHLDQWNIFNTVGGDPFGATFIGAVDLTRVGTMGHSRGGEGVSRHYTYNRELGSPYGVQAVLPLAPVNFSRELLDGVNINVFLPYCDGDVADLQGAHYFDDAQYVPGEQTNKHFTTIMGGNHSYFNTIWTPGGWPAGTWDDWQAFQDMSRVDPWCADTQPGNHKLTPPQERGVFMAYGTAFYRLYLGGEVGFLPLLKGDAPPPPSAMTNEILMTYQAKDAPGSRLDVNRLLSSDDLSTNTLGGAVAQSGLNPYDLCGGLVPQPQHCIPTGFLQNSLNRMPHTTPSARSSMRGLSQLRFGWDDTSATLFNELPAGAGDVSAYNVLQFRGTVNFRDARNTPGVPQDFSVTLTDGAGSSATTVVSASSGAFYYPPGRPTPLSWAIPKLIHNAIRIPLSQFPGIDLTNVQSVQFNFDQQPQGALLISDILFGD
jgi:hypothetical protein